MALLRAWTARVQFGYWMHTGMLSWDSGLGFKRWMKAKTWAYALQGPLAIACSPHFHLDPRQGAWAKYVFDRGLEQFAIRCERLHAAPPPLRAPLRRRREPTRARAASGSTSRGWARTRCGRSSTGSARCRAEPPPPVYSFDADVGRLSVSTPRYSAAIVADNGGAFPYGGIDLARLFDAAGRAGRRRRRAAAGELRASCCGAPAAPRARDAGPRPRGAELSLDALAARAGDRRRGGCPATRTPGRSATWRRSAASRAARRAVAVRHRFAADYVESTWTVTRRPAAAARRGAVPELGRRRARRSSPCSPTERRRAAGAPGAGRRRRRSRYFHLAGPRGGYVARARRRRPRASARARRAPAVGAAAGPDARGRAARRRRAARPDRARRRRGPRGEIARRSARSRSHGGRVRRGGAPRAPSGGSSRIANVSRSTSATPPPYMPAVAHAAHNRQTLPAPANRAVAPHQPIQPRPRPVAQRLEAQRVHVVGLLAQDARPAAHGRQVEHHELVVRERAVAADRHPAAPRSTVSQRIGLRPLPRSVQSTRDLAALSLRRSAAMHGIVARARPARKSARRRVRASARGRSSRPARRRARGSSRGRER